MQRYTTNIFFTPRVYKAIRPYDFGSLLGMVSTALGGGAFGLANIFYVLLFGMNRLTPWGLVHRIPFFFQTKPNPVFERSDINEVLKLQTSSIRSSEFYNIDLEKAPLTADYNRWAEKTQDEHPLPEAPSIEPSSVMADDKSFHASERRQDLEARVQELERILADYFLDTRHLDRMRRKSYRQSMT
ncbi:unnamed protein product [Umbelopsis sp. WA50703]